MIITHFLGKIDPNSGKYKKNYQFKKKIRNSNDN